MYKRQGMLLIMYEMKKQDKQRFYEYYNTLRNMLWKYTDYMYGKADDVSIRNTGLYLSLIHILRFHGIYQHDVRDCGVACLATISEYYGLKVPLSYIRDLEKVNMNGSSI